jgi:hypothetical protein
MADTHYVAVGSTASQVLSAPSPPAHVCAVFRDFLTLEWHGMSVPF